MNICISAPTRRFVVEVEEEMVVEVVVVMFHLWCKKKV